MKIFINQNMLFVHQNALSLCIFKPNEITKFAFTEAIKREWDASILNKIKAQNIAKNHY